MGVGICKCVRVKERKKTEKERYIRVRTKYESEKDIERGKRVQREMRGREEREIK